MSAEHDPMAELDRIEVEAELDRAVERARRAETRLVEAVLAAAAAGVSEAEIARRTGIARMTVRKRLGKG